ncbi:UNVERIFIED_CONTAM: hypothetical protein BEN50_17995 [Euhalothece sp. KZN 001]
MSIMKRAAFLSLVALSFAASTARAEFTERELREIRDTVRIDLSKIADDSSKWSVIRITPFHSGRNLVLNAHINGKTGTIITTGPWITAREYEGTWKLLHTFTEDRGEVKTGRYRVRLESGRQGKQYMMRNPFFDPYAEGGTLLVCPEVGPRFPSDMFLHQYVIRSEDLPHLSQAVSFLRDHEHREQDAAILRDPANEELRNNVFLRMHVLLQHLENSKNITDEEIENVLMNVRNRMLAHYAAAVADSGNLTESQRADALLTIAGMLDASQRMYVLAGLCAVDGYNADVLSVLAKRESRTQLFDEISIGALPQSLQKILRDII